MEVQRQRAESAIEKQIDAMNEASSRITNLKRGEIEVSEVA